MQLHEERVLETLQDLPLRVNLRKLDLVLLDTIFLYKLHGVELSSRALSDHVYGSKTTSAQHLDEVKVAQRGHLL